MHGKGYDRNVGKAKVIPFVRDRVVFDNTGIPCAGKYHRSDERECTDLEITAVRAEQNPCARE